VLVFSSGGIGWPELRWRVFDDAGIPTYYASFRQSPVPKTRLLVFRLQLHRAIRRAIREWGKPDVIHTQDGYAFHVMKAAARLDVGFLISQHSTAFLERKLAPASVRQFGYAFLRASRVLAANRFAAADYSHYGLTADTAWLPNALDTSVFFPPTDAYREPWLLHVSGFTPGKSVPDVVRAFAQVRAARPEAVLHLAGDGTGRAEAEALAARSLPAGSYRFHGALAKHRIADLMRRSRGFVFPGEAETFGCVLMEAMACGCPVLTTRTGGVPAVVREGEGIFTEVGAVDHIAAGMLALLDGSHGLDMARISRRTRRRFGYEAVGSVLHREHLRAAAKRARVH
jgi:glycosyltransferase involved in cell wall biosynthesis